MDMWVPLKEKEKKKDKSKHSKSNWPKDLREAASRWRKFLFSFIRFSQIYENLTVVIRRDKHEKCSTRRGLRVCTKNKRFHREFR